MYTKKQVIRKILLGAVLLAAAVGITIVMRENMNVQEPEKALPTITITMDGDTVFARDRVFLAGYEWNFLTMTAKHTPPYSAADLKHVTPPVPMEPRTYLELDFSIKPKELVISRASDPNLESYMELTNVGMGPLITPAEPGIYRYQVQASFGWRGSTVYFFTVQIEDLDKED